MSLQDRLAALISSIGADMKSKLNTADAPELIRDTIASALVQGSGVTIVTNDSADQIIISASASTPLLGHCWYTASNPATNSTTIVDLDATNLAVTFTAPPSGSVVVRLTGQNFMSGSGTTYWGLRSGTTQVALGELQRVSVVASMTKAFKVTGLTPGTAYTYKWAARVDAGTLTLMAANGGGALMEVMAL